MNIYHFLPTQSEDIPGIKYYLHSALSQIALSMSVNQQNIDKYILQSHIRYKAITFDDTTGNVGDVIPKDTFIEAISINIQAFDGDVVLKVGDADNDVSFAEVSNSDMLQTQRMFVTTAPLTGTALTKNTQALFTLVGTATQGAAQIAIICRAT